MSDLIRAWATLIALSLGSTALAVSAIPPAWQPAAGAAILILAWAKARVILARYLGLAAAPFWARGFGIALGVFCVVLLVLYLIAITL
ncbi:nitric oxide reductase F protein [Pukyongiella litopenaei]|nr:nitric oxide reductase F protein [Pukyongiella litopenaei]